MATDSATKAIAANPSQPASAQPEQGWLAPRGSSEKQRFERGFRVHAELRVCVVGLGYIGLPTASLLGTKGYAVTGIDIRPEVVATINQGRIHIVEPDLDLLVKSAVQAGHLRAALAPVPADVYILAVPTPILPDKQPDLAAVEAATRSIAGVLARGALVILESTSPVGTTEEVVAAILREHGHAVGEDVYVAYCPERVLPGRILTELVENDRVVGGINEASTQAAVAFYQSFVRGEVIATSSRVAEMVKLSENSFRDVNIAFANELSMLCAREGISVWEVIQLANRHPRVEILRPGPGVGGHCIAVDPWFLVARAPEQARLIRAAREVNDHKPRWVLERVRECAARFKHPVIAVLGLSFKADVDDLRESPAVEIALELKHAALGELLVVEPHIDAHPELPLARLEDALARADIVLVLVDHKAFKRVRREQLAEKVVIDTRGMLV